ncbi:hypothetical protein T492DRAFT_885171 [Pavlovales sp. CCMP2436]|nr:hypothetical protein T492DRAFT_885171 [Pavlovales sp. CCMP2436]
MVARELLRVAVAQICQGAGFARAQEAACELLVDVLLKWGGAWWSRCCPDTAESDVWTRHLVGSRGGPGEA